jgi:selenocysteine lyase/cysteine desulfurase
MCAGITVYNVEGYTGPKLQDEMWNRGRLRPRATGDVFGVRHSTHIYNSTAEIDRALHIVKQLAS